MAVLFPLFPPPLFLSPTLNLFRWVARSGGGEKWPKIFWKVVEGRVSSLIHSRPELFKNLNDGTGRSKYLHYAMKNNNLFSSHISNYETMETILSCNNNFQVYFFNFFFIEITRKSKSLDKFISNGRINAIFVNYKRYIITNLNEINEKLPNISFTNLYPFIILFNPSEHPSFFFPPLLFFPLLFAQVLTDRHRTAFL